MIDLPTGDQGWEVWVGSWWPCCIWCVSTLSGIKEGGGRLGWGKGQEEERRSKRAGGEGEGERAGREAEPKGRVGRVPPL